jgi:glutathione S-transferase
MRKILGRITSINLRKVAWTLDYFGLEYERETWGLPDRDPKVPEFLKYNPNGFVPVLIEDDFVLWESDAIMRYLAQTHGPTSLWPEDPHQRAIADQWMSWASSILMKGWIYAVMALVRKMPGFDDEAKIEASLNNWISNMRILEAHLATSGPYVTGDSFTLADIALGVCVHRWFMADVSDLPDMPYARAYYERLKTQKGALAALGSQTP